MERLTPLLNPDAVSPAWEAFTTAARVSTPAGVAAFREQFLARFAGPEALEKPARRAREAAVLSRPARSGDGLYDYRLTLDAEAMATLEAALGPMSAPAPNTETGEPDMRPESRRRAEALLQLVTAGIHGCDPGYTRSAHLFLTIPAADLIPTTRQYRTSKRQGSETGAYQGGNLGSSGSSPPAAGDPTTNNPRSRESDLPTGHGAEERTGTPHSDPPAPLDLSASRHGAGTVVGSTAPNLTLLPLSSVAKIACDALVTPVITFPDGSPLHLGRTARLFTPAQYRALILRDRGCTFPGCGAPATWTRAHHLIHWIHGGLTDLDNAALLCQRHHTLVHTKRYIGHLTTTGNGQQVTWNLTPGSYDEHLGAAPAPRR